MTKNTNGKAQLNEIPNNGEAIIYEMFLEKKVVDVLKKFRVFCVSVVANQLKCDTKGFFKGSSILRI